MILEQKASQELAKIREEYEKSNSVLEAKKYELEQAIQNLQLAGVENASSNNESCLKELETRRINVIEAEKINAQKKQEQEEAFCKLERSQRKSLTASLKVQQMIKKYNINLANQNSSQEFDESTLQSIKAEIINAQNIINNQNNLQGDANETPTTNAIELDGKDQNSSEEIQQETEPFSSDETCQLPSETNKFNSHSKHQKHSKKKKSKLHPKGQNLKKESNHQDIEIIPDADNNKIKLDNKNDDEKKIKSHSKESKSKLHVKEQNFEECSENQNIKISSDHLNEEEIDTKEKAESNSNDDKTSHKTMLSYSTQKCPKENQNEKFPVQASEINENKDPLENNSSDNNTKPVPSEKPFCFKPHKMLSTKIPMTKAETNASELRALKLAESIIKNQNKPKRSPFSKFNPRISPNNRS